MSSNSRVLDGKCGKLLKNGRFSYSRPKMAVISIFQDRFFIGHFFGLQEGSMQLEILIPPMVAFENLVSGSS